jgi:hypothetical protein
VSRYSLGKTFVVAFLLVMAGPYLFADYGLGSAFRIFRQDFLAYMTDTLDIVMPIFLFYGCGRVAWKFSHGQEFTSTLMFMIVGYAVLLGIDGAGFVDQTSFDEFKSSFKGTIRIIGPIFGTLIALIGGGYGGYLAITNRPWIKQMIYAICGAAVIAVSY